MQNRKLTRLEQFIILVANGEKPGCSVTISGAARRYAKKYDLECLLSTPADGNKLIGKPTMLEIGRRENCISVINRIGLPNIPRLEERTYKLMCELKHDSIAQALVKLGSYPRVDSNFPIVEEENRERPEVAVLQGIFYGYNVCCIEYAVKTLYFDEPMVDWVEDIWNIEGDINPHTRCEMCTRKILGNLKKGS